MKDNFDSLWLTKRYLEGYRGQKEYISLLESEIQDRYETATSIVAMYEEHIGHSSVEKLHPGAKLAMDLEFQEKRNQLMEAKKIVSAIDSGIDDLPGIEKRIIQMRYFESKPVPWIKIAKEVNYCERKCMYFHKKSLRHIATFIFGLEVVFKKERRSIG